MRILALILTTALLLGCGSDGGSSDTTNTPGTTEGTGQLRLLLSDSPVDDADEVNLRVARVEVRRVTDTGSEWVVLWRGDREFDPFRAGVRDPADLDAGHPQVHLVGVVHGTVREQQSKLAGALDGAGVVGGVG